MAELSREVFLAHMDPLRADVAAVKEHLDKLNGRTRDAELKLAVLEDRGHPGAWGGGLGALVVGLVEGIRWLTK